MYAIRSYYEQAHPRAGDLRHRAPGDPQLARPRQQRHRARLLLRHDLGGLRPVLPLLPHADGRVDAGAFRHQLEPASYNFV